MVKFVAHIWPQCTKKRTQYASVSLRFCCKSANYEETFAVLEGDFVVRESFKAYLLSVIHRLYRDDSWVNNLFDSAGMSLSEVSAYLDVVKGNLYFEL